MSEATGRHVSKGLIAGVTATVVMSAMMLMKQSMGFMPQLNPIAMLTEMVGASTPVVGWALHFMIGTVMWGVLFALLAPRLPGAMWLRGVLFGIGAWLLMMVMVMPMAGAGFFGLGMGIAAPILTLVMHLVFGAVLGGVYGVLTDGIDPKLAHVTTHTWM